MESVPIKKFRIQNLDCASCAVENELELQKTEMVEGEALDFAGLTLHLKTADFPGKGLSTWVFAR